MSVLEAALDVIAERGLDETRMVDIGERAGMSAGHVMYYFPTKADLLMQALKWSEDRFLAEAERAIEALPSARHRLWRLIELSVPSPGIDPAWILWLETWARAPHDRAVARFQLRIEERWLALLGRVVREGQASHEFVDIDVEPFVVSLSALIDGLSIRRLGGGNVLTRDEQLRICEAELERTLMRHGPATRRGAPRSRPNR